MTPAAFLSLALQTVTAPRDVARLLLSIRPGSEALITAFALVVVLNALVYGLSVVALGEGGMAALISAPLAFMALQALTLGLVIAMLSALGRALGGVARLEDVALLLIWLQALRVLAQLGIMVLMLVTPALGSLAVLIVSALGVWIAVHFVDEAHGLQNMLKSVAVLVGSVLGMALAISVILTALGVAPEGVVGNV